LNSCLYRGTVWHTRSRLTNASPGDKAPAYRFAYSVWYLGLDLAEAGEVDAKLRLFSHNRLNLTSFWDKDYLALQNPDSGQAPAFRPGINASSTQLVTMPRFLNYVFNPFSVFITRDADRRMAYAIAEVHNTWGERHLYDLRQVADANRRGTPRGCPDAPASETPGSTYNSEVDKAFYVSPFISPEGRYHVALQEEASGRLQIRIDESDGKGLFFQAGIDVTPLPLTDVNLLRLLVRFPFVNLKTVAMIHWQGVKLWLRGEPFRRNPSRARRKPRPEVVR
jgi:DUF1365 family protein